MDLKRKICDIRTWEKKNETHPPPTLIHLSHRFTSASTPTIQASFEPHPRLSFNVYIIRETSVTKRTKQTEVTRGQIRAVNRMLKKFPLQFLNSLLGSSGCMWVWHCHDEAAPLLPVGLEVFYKLHVEAPTEFHNTMQNSHFSPRF
jgi:hypothetical protein